MGIDLLDIFFEIEKKFGIKLEREDFFQMVKSKFGDTTPLDSAWADLKVHDLIEWVSQEVETQNPNATTNIRVQKIVELALLLDEYEVHSDAWLVRDPGME